MPCVHMHSREQCAVWVMNARSLVRAVCFLCFTTHLVRHWVFLSTLVSHGRLHYVFMLHVSVLHVYLSLSLSPHCRLDIAMCMLDDCVSSSRTSQCSWATAVLPLSDFVFLFLWGRAHDLPVCTCSLSPTNQPT